ncbi:hypothetical protein YC2023_118840 [Brassica napus]
MCHTFTTTGSAPVYIDATFHKATLFSYYASGYVQPNKTASHPVPGLVYDLDTGDYLDFLCAIAYKNTLVRLFAEDPQYTCCQGDANSITFSERP